MRVRVNVMVMVRVRIVIRVRVRTRMLQKMIVPKTELMTIQLKLRLGLQ